MTSLLPLTPLVCKKCGTSHNSFKKCPSASIHSAVMSGDGDSDMKEREKKAKAECGKCPLCKGYHTFFYSRERKHWPSDRLFKCEDFRKQTVKERASVLEKFGCCPKCTSWNHKRSSCTVVQKCSADISGKKCGGAHSTMVCGSGNAYCGAVKPTYVSTSDTSDCSDVDFPDLTAETLLVFQDVQIAGVVSPARLVWDDGSTRGLVTHEYARACGMRSENIVYRLDVVGSKGEPEQGCYYEFELVKNNGSRKKVWAYGIDKIMEPPDHVDLSSVQHLFPHLPSSVFQPRSQKSPDILLGNNFLGLHPSGGQGRDAVGDLRAYQSDFGDGWVLAGTHPDLKPGRCSLTSSAYNLARVFKCEIVPELLPSFWEGECMGVLPPKRCGRCLRCTECTDPALIRSRKDQEELDILEKSVKLVNGKLHVSYPFKRDPHILPNNRSTVVKMAESQERRLLKSGHFDFYTSEMQKYVDRGVVVKLSKQDMEEWKGPVNYISHHGVEKPSVTTPLRIVTNSSLKNGSTSLNGCMIAGPNSLNSMMDIGLRFRCHETGMVFDLTKAYNSLLTGPIERNLRRFVWRRSPDEEWEDWAFDCVAFGDLPAANFLEIGRNLTADFGKHIDPVASKKIEKDSYVDDNVSGGSAAEVKRMQGVRLPDGTYSGTMRQILDLGNLKIKVILATGETDEDLKHLIGNKVLGYCWDATSDNMGVTFTIYLCNKKRKVWTKPALTADTLHLLESTPLTKRICLAITNGIFDFMGIACPFTIRFKLLMRQLFEGQNKQMNWEDKIPDDVLEAWKLLIAEAVQSSSLCFPRCTRPANAVGNPLVAGFGDGALPAFCAAIYLQWQVTCSHGQAECDYDYEASLLCGKARVTPLTGYTVPRSELSGVVLETRLALTSVKALQTEPSMKPKGVVLMADSECTISAVDTTTRALKPFFHNRVSEVLENMSEMKKYCPVEDIHHVPTELNPADLATRGNTKVCDIGPDSFWQRGPSFLCSKRDLWPISRDFVRADVPDDEVRGKPAFLACLRAYAMTSSALSSSLPDMWLAVQRVTQYSNSINKVIRILARLIKGWQMKSRREVPTVDNIGEPTANELESAERLLLLSAMPDTVNAEVDGKLASLCPEKDGNIVVTSGRIGEKSLSRLLGVPHLPILMPQSRSAYLYMVQAHEGEQGTVHNSLVETLARSRNKVWIHKGRDLAKKVCSQCPLCRRRGKDLASQQMAKIKEESLTMCRPFTYISLDFAGPVKVKGAVNSRAKLKCWITVYCCRSTKAVVLLATCGYDTQSFLLKHEEFVARHGAPATIVSDRGTQLVSAGRILSEKADDADKQTPGKWNWSKITKENSASNWHFVPIGSPHFNGLPEATVKVLKKTLSLALHPGTELTYPELVTLLAKIAYTVNSRPLGLANVSPSSQQEDHMLPLTPNHMLLARSSNISPPLEYSAADKFSSRLAYVAEVEKEWWDRWIKQVLPTLFSYKKWKVKQENIKAGELVMLKYPGQFKDDYCIAKVTEVHPSEDGLVRQVSVSYRKKNSRESPTVCKSKPLITEKVAIHRLHRLQLADEAVQLDAGQVDDEAAG